MSTTSIEWTDRVWNPVTGCTKVSQGCKHCYAETIANRFWATQYPKNADGSERKFTDVRCHPERLDEPLHWKKPSRVFVNSMSDLFHENVPYDFIADVFVMMARAKQHTFQVLTKRPRNMNLFFEDCLSLPPDLPSSNVWLGVSCEDQETADERIPLLLQTPAAVRFVSAEPLLGSIDLRITEKIAYQKGHLGGGLHWLIVGGESGQGARPMNPAWARQLRDQCKAVGVAFFMKQMDKKTEIPEDLFIREFPKENASWQK